MAAEDDVPETRNTTSKTNEVSFVVGSSSYGNSLVVNRNPETSFSHSSLKRSKKSYFV
jgi:hypothetical protein